jgi:hypothetical protein
MICCGLQDDLIANSRAYNQNLVTNGVRTAMGIQEGFV